MSGGNRLLVVAMAVVAAAFFAVLGPSSDAWGSAHSVKSASVTITTTTVEWRQATFSISVTDDSPFQLYVQYGYANSTFTWTNAGAADPAGMYTLTYSIGGTYDGGGLDTSTAYRVRAYVIDGPPGTTSGPTSYSDYTTFTTRAITPGTWTTSSVQPTANGATIIGNVATNGSDQTVNIQWGKTSSLGYATNGEWRARDTENDSTVQMTIGLDSLAPNTTYYWRVVLSGEDDTVDSQIESFTTTAGSAQPPPPSTGPQPAPAPGPAPPAPTTVSGNGFAATLSSLRVLLGDTFTYTTSFTNPSGSPTLVGETLVFGVFQSMQIVSYSSTSGSCLPGGSGSVFCHLNPVLPGTTVTATATLKSLAVGSFSYNSYLSPEPGMGGASPLVKLAVVRRTADVAVALFPRLSIGEPGGQLRVALATTNNGPDPVAPAIQVATSTGLALVSTKPALGCLGDYCRFGVVQPGATSVATLLFRMIRSGRQRVTATAWALDWNDPVEIDDVAIAVVTVRKKH